MGKVRVKGHFVPVVAGGSATMTTPEGEDLVYLDGPLYPNGCRIEDFAQGSLFTCHDLAVMMGIVMIKPELVGELIWAEGDQVCAAFTTPVYGGNGLPLRVERRVVRTDRWVSKYADSLGKAPYVALWVKLMLWLYGGWSWNLLRVARDPRDDIFPLGFNVVGALARDVTPESLGNVINGYGNFAVGVTQNDAVNLIPGHVYLVEFVDRKTKMVMLHNTWGYDGPSSWGDAGDGRILMPWDTLVKNLDAFRWTDGIYWTPTGLGGTAPKIMPFPKRPPPVSPVVP